MKQLLQKSNILARQTSLNIVRDAFHQIHWESRLIGILGARGVGKTTLLLQHLKKNYSNSGKALYATIDDKYFLEHTISDLAESFRNNGGQTLYLDEIHKYDGWAREIKNIYDLYKDVKIVITGFSIVNLLRQDVDLSKRIVPFHLNGLSFREFLIFKDIQELPKFSLEEILKKHVEISEEISSQFKPLPYLKEYLHYGYYPFFMEGKETYPIRLENIIRTIIEHDLKFIESIDPTNYRKVYQLLYILAANVPFKPNISKLSRKIGLNRNTLVQYLHYLEKAKLIHMLNPSGSSISILQKPEKVLLENTNIQFVLAEEQANPGTLRAIFFASQLKNSGADISLSKKGDFLINEKFTFELGGKNKSDEQIKDVKQSYLAIDDIETGYLEYIPLWLFGFLY